MNKLPIILSKLDEVPDDYIGITDLFTNEVYVPPQYTKEKWCLDIKTLQRLRNETFREVKKRFDLCNANSYARFWNGNIEAINDIGINRFLDIECFTDLVSAVICFEKTTTAPRTLEKRKLISFGIRKEILREYHKNWTKALETGSLPKQTNTYDRHKKRNGNIHKECKTKVLIPDENGKTKSVTLRGNALYNQFSYWCKVKGITKQKAIYQAINLLMQKEPITELHELGAYERKCDLDFSEIVIPEKNIETISVLCRLPKKHYDKMREIIERFNLDLDNIGKPTLTMQNYIFQAIDLLNQKSPLKYSDPKAFREHLEAEEAKRYNLQKMEENI